MKRILGSNRYLSEWILLLGGLLLVVAVIGVNFYREYVGIGNRERERLATQASVLNKGLDQALEVVDNALIGIRNDLPGWRSTEGGISETSHRLRAFADAMRIVHTMLVLDADGNIIAASRPELIGINVSYRPYFIQARANPNPDILYITPPLKSVFGAWVMNVVRVIQGPEGQFAGVILAALDPEALRDQVGAVLYHKDMWAAIAHGDGLQVVMAPDRPGQDGLNLAQPGSIFSRYMASGQMSQVLEGTSVATGEYRLMALHTVRPPNLPMDKPLVVAVGRNIEALYVGWYAQLWLTGGLLLLLVGGAVPALAYVQQRRQSADVIKAQADAALAQSEYFMRSLINVIPGMVGYWTKELRSTFANDAYLDWFGKTKEQMKGIHIHDLMGDELFQKNDSYIRAALAGERQSFERTLVKADGSIGYTWTHYIPDFMNGQVQGFFVLVSDVTDLKKSEAALRENRRFLQDLIEHSGTLISAKDKEGKYLLVNQMYEQLTGHYRDQVLGHTDLEIYSDQEALPFIENDKFVMSSMKTQRFEELLGAHHFLTTKFPLLDGDGNLSGVCGISADITEQKELQRKMELLANTDALTRLANRRRFHELAELEISRARRFTQNFSVLMLDIDNFKSINDRYGHDVGDKVIAYIGDLCRNELRDIDIAGRLGGEEFAILLPGTSSGGGREVAERLRRDIENHEMELSEGTVLKFTVSIGCVSSTDLSLDIEQLLKRADQCLYEAKRSGRNRVVL
ncbi:MAG: diguanylate cyclase [Burkholderiaceae bacterium]|nr:diguanylate cyclase [Burkholderiaceae bacterium]